jgi:hypothetical protein
MTEDGKKIVGMFKELRRVCGDIALLLGTCDSLMQEHGWTPLNNIAKAGSSNSIGYPAGWLPYYAFRYYGNESHPQLLAFVSVIFDNANKEKPDRVSQALVSAGFYDYGEGKVPKGWNYYYASIHVYIKGASDDRQWIDAELHEVWPKEKKQGVKVSTFAAPLTEITDTENLRERMVLPFIRKIEEKNEHQQS